MQTSRRAFLRSGPALAVLGLGSTTIAGERPMTTPARESSFDPWIEVHAEHLRHNVQEVRRHVGGRPILAVIKDNGYGSGVVEVGGLLDGDDAVAGFAVIKVDEALRLRDAGVKKPVLLMGTFDDQNLEELVARDVTPMVYQPIGPVWDRLSSKMQKPIPIHVCVDTGIGRVGVPYTEAGDLIRDLAARPSVRIDGLMMTFAEDPGLNVEQPRRFARLYESLQRDGVATGQRHAASTDALFRLSEDAFMDMVRPGMALYGIYPDPQFRVEGRATLRPAVSLKARVAYLKKLPEGGTAGYHRSYVATDEVWVATVPVGHSDGWPRVAAKGARVRIGDALYPLIGTVSGNHSIVEIGPEPKVEVGDVVTLFDWQDGSRPEDVSAACGASVYDLTMHLNPLLPRRIVGA